MKRLGRGLESLIQDVEKPTTGTVSTINIDLIKPNRFQPRRIFNEEKLNELADSIKENGLIQPLVIAKINENEYELIAGERRLQACKMCGLKEVHVHIKEVDEKTSFVLAIIENIQREDLTPIEEAKSYKRLIDEFDLQHQDIAKIMSKERTTITNSLRLLKLSENIQSMIDNKQLSPGHARAVLSVNEDLQEDFAKRIIEKSLNVRKAEEEAKTLISGTTKTPKVVPEPMLFEKSYIKQTEKSMTKSLGQPVKIKEKGNASGDLIIHFDNKETLEKLVRLLS